MCFDDVCHSKFNKGSWVIYKCKLSILVQMCQSFLKICMGLTDDDLGIVCFCWYHNAARSSGLYLYLKEL